MRLCLSLLALAALAAGQDSADRKARIRGIRDYAKLGPSAISKIEPYLADGRLSIVSHAPEFHYPAYVVHALNNDSEALGPALQGLRQVASELGR